MTTKKAVIFSVIITALLTSSITSFVKDVLEVYVPSKSTRSTMTAKLNLVDSILNKYYLYDYDKAKLADDAVEGYLEGLNEPYTHYYNAEDFKSYRGNIEDTYVGIGAIIGVNENNQMEIISAIEGNSAYDAGVMPKDILTAVDGVAYDGSQMSEAVAQIKNGEAGSIVTLTLIRNEGVPFDLQVERKSVSYESVNTEMLDGNIGYVRITAFNTSAEDGNEQDTYTEFKEKVTKLQEDGMKKMIIDLRDNPGGALDVVCNIADMILPEGLITYTEYKDGTREEYKSDAYELDIPITVLINGNSASASEVLTGALRDYNRATVIGTTSYGKGIVQSVYPFSDGSGMSLTVAKYYTPNGICIHETGIEPDITVEAPKEYKDSYAAMIPFEKDTQLQKAIEVLNEK